MASNAQTSAGSRISIAVFPGTENPTTSDYEALTWLEISEVTNIGEFGKEYNLSTHNPLATRRTVKRKGSFNDGSMTVDMALDGSDEGQRMLIEAANSDDSYAFKVTTQGNREIYYFPGQVMSSPVNIGGVDDITSKSVTIELDGEIVDGTVGGSAPTEG